MELRQYTAILWRWKWLLALCTLLAAVAAFVVSSWITPVFEASTILFINQAPDSRTSDYTAILASERLARTYAEMLTNRPVLEEALSRLELSIDPEDLKDAMDVQLVPDTQLIEVKVQGPNPWLAAILADSIVEVFAEQVDALQASRFAASKSSLVAQLDKLSEQIREAEDQIEALSSAQLDKLSERIREAEDHVEALSSIEIAPDLDNEAAIVSLDTLQTDSRRTELESRLAELTQYRVSYTTLQTGGGAELERRFAELTQYRVSYTNLLLSYEELRIAEARSISNIIQVEPAKPAKDPIRPRTLFNTLLAGVVGAMIALGAVFLIEYLDDTIKSAEDVARATQLPVIGYVENSKKLAVSRLRERVMISEPNSPLAESFRSVRTSIELAGTQGTPRSILVASPGSGEGKTTIAAQLAMSMAQGGKKVVLLDANLRQPSLHKYFGIENKLGLADMLVDDLVPQVVAQELIHWRLKVITSGKAVDNPAELMGSIMLLKVLTRLREQADVAIFDGPSFLVAESLILASKLESVLMVMRYGGTREAVATHVMQQLSRAKANLIGVAMNRVPIRMANDLSGSLAYGFGERSAVSGSGIDKPSHVKRPVALRKGTGS